MIPKGMAASDIIFHHVSSKSSNQEEIRKFLGLAGMKDHETNNSSCLITFHHVSSKSRSQI